MLKTQFDPVRPMILSAVPVVLKPQQTLGRAYSGALSLLGMQADAPGG